MFLSACEPSLCGSFMAAKRRIENGRSITTDKRTFFRTGKPIKTTSPLTLGPTPSAISYASQVATDTKTIGDLVGAAFRKTDFLAGPVEKKVLEEALKAELFRLHDTRGKWRFRGEIGDRMCEVNVTKNSLHWTVQFQNPWAREWQTIAFRARSMA